MHATEEQTLEAIEAYHGRHAAPLEAGSDDDEAGVPSLAAVLGAEDVRLEQAEYLTMIAKGVETLSDSDRLILYLRFGRDMTQSEIAAGSGRRRCRCPGCCVRRSRRSARSAASTPAE